MSGEVLQCDVITGLKAEQCILKYGSVHLCHYLLSSIKE